jgi:O-antigen/teichoic acid export membrane protein
MVRIDLFWVILGRLAAAIIALISIRLSTTLLPPDQYGSLAVLITFQAFCGLFIVNPVGQYINRNSHAWADEETLTERLLAYKRFVLLAGITGALAIGTWTLTQSMSWSERILQMIAILVTVIAATWNATYIGMLNILGFRAISVAWATVTAFVSLIVSGVLVMQSSTGIAWFIGQAVGLALGALGSGRALHKLFLKAPQTQRGLFEKEALFKYILPLAGATAFMWWQLAGYRLIIEYHWGLAALGMFAVGFGLASQLWALAESVAMQFMFPLFYRRISGATAHEGRQAFSDLVNTLGPMYLVLASASLVSAPALIWCLIAPSYNDVFIFLIIGIFAECARTLTNAFSTAAQVELRMSALILPYGIGALLITVFLEYASRSGGDLIFGVAATVIAGAGLLLTMIWRMHRLMSFNLDLKRWGAALLLLCFVGHFLLGSPVQVRSWGDALGVLIATTLATVSSLTLLHYKNPAMRRLLTTQLKPKFIKGQ